MVSLRSVPVVAVVSSRSVVTVSLRSVVTYPLVAVYSVIVLTCFVSFEPTTGHYSQLVWAETEYVGCGHITYANNNSRGYKRLLVCNYGPAGNFIGQPVYIRATPCSMCPFRSTCMREQQLCHNEDDNDNNNGKFKGTFTLLI